MATTRHVFDDSGAWYEVGQIPKELANIDFDMLWDLHPEEHGKVKIGGKEIDVPRWQQVYLQDYRFSGMNHKKKDLPKEFEPFYEYAKTVFDKRYNQLVINWYKDGKHYIGAHSDNETELIKNSSILSISLGETRTFRIRSSETGEIIKDFELQSGTFFVMGGNFQKKYTHEIVKVMGEKGAKLGRRINLTYRMFD